MFIEQHIIQNVPPSNLNRDDTGSPKDCEFGGLRRGRISSQSLKRAIRFHDLFRNVEGTTPSYRTKLIGKEVTDRLIKLGHESSEANLVVKRSLEEAGFGKEKEEKTSILIFLNASTLDRIAAIISENFDGLNQKAVKNIPVEIMDKVADAVASETLSPDLALFGRMIAVDPKTPLGKINLNIDASCQVAHAISTHKITPEMDYFTAVDDLQPEAETGAGMIGMVDFNSSCYYRYSVVETRQLIKNLGNDQNIARHTVDAFLRASIESLPSGKQNSFAAHTRPAFALFIVRTGQPLSLVNAFEKPIVSSAKQGLITASIEALDRHYGSIYDVYGNGDEKDHCFISTEESSINRLGNPATNLEECISQTLNAAFAQGA